MREIVATYREAALGLAAAHASGLVHRDFKPDNAMLGDDGRVRVLDFGIAHESGDRAGVAGTPHYMPPEQAAGAELTAAVDQYALGVALREALGPEPPKWLAAIVTRATATEPAQRFPSMHELVEALGRDPARVRRKRLAFAGALMSAGLAFLFGGYTNEGAGETCAGGSAEVEGVWSAADHDRAIAHLESLGPYGAQIAKRAAGELDRYAARWASTHAGACRAHERRELTRELYTGNLTCLTYARVALATARNVLETTTLERLPDALVAVQSLPAVERCRDELAPLPTSIATRGGEIANAITRARVLALAVDPRAIELGASAARQATELGHPLLVGRATLVHGLALLLQQQRPAAAAAFARAATAALEANDIATAIEAFARRMYAIATYNTTGDKDAMIASVEFTTALAKGLGGRDAFVRALYHNNLGTLQLTRGDRAGARAMFEEADRVRPMASWQNHELATIAGNRGLLERDPARRDAHLEREGNELERVVGIDHPMTLDARLKAAMFIAHPQRSAARLTATCDRYRAMHPHLSEKIMQCAYEVLWLAEERGDVRAAREAMAAFATPNALEGQIALAYGELFAGRPAVAARAMRAAAAAFAKRPHFWARWRSIDARLLAAIAAYQAGQREAAIADAEQTLTSLGGLGDFASSVFVQRRRGRVLALLAVLGAGDVVARADAAITWAASAGGYDDRIAVLRPLSSSR